MKILLDESVPVQARGALIGHAVSTVSEIGWKGRENGESLTAAEDAGFDLLIIADKNLRYQQNLQGRKISLVELWTNHRPTLERHFELISSIVGGASPGSYSIITPPP